MESARVTGLPLGFRFEPIDEELILYFLYNKVHGKPLDSNMVIDCDLYGEEELWREIFEESKENTHYFFTKLKKKSENGSRVERSTRCGTWKTQKDEKIYLYVEKNGKMHIGSKRSFTFVPKKGFRDNGRWIMHEYRLDGFLINNETHHVLCRVKKKIKEREQKEETEEVLETTEPASVMEHMGSSNTTNSVITIDSVIDGFDCCMENPNLWITMEELKYLLSS